eukprot:CAMPEP_0202910844 /NCGR_PEP_ID=MMETSP1392-20130828/53188_1 /ASSEMBLY_ACC=CAM_ASM_000868 /TAXON_ID=225041 /ORGANISM="Chlamydomonas chlamydogama, Strain SAG 11-48b" /LENGTH=49 /DNA_ID=CAMNT_0049601107 /DNA_START=108 /DNA_END=257 /DNA_ORIENTATION=+
MWSLMNSSRATWPKSKVPMVCSASLMSAPPCSSPVASAADNAWNLGCGV